MLLVNGRREAVPSAESCLKEGPKSQAGGGGREESGERIEPQCVARGYEMEV